jgi:hypothetical protein
MEQIIQAVNSYLTGLDWPYILTFIMLAYLVNQAKVRAGISKFLRIKTRTRYRVAVTGILYGVVTYFVRGYGLQDLERLFHSFVFALVFHKLVIDVVMQYVAGKSVGNKGNLPQDHA